MGRLTEIVCMYKRYFNQIHKPYIICILTRIGSGLSSLNLTKRKYMKSLYKCFILLVLLSASTVQADVTKVSMETNMGTIVLELYPDKAPVTVANFLQYVNEGYFNGTIFHRVISNFMIQGGGFSVSSEGKFERKQTRDAIKNEASNGLKNDTGTIAMARTFEPHSATSQFFINVSNNASLNYSSPSPRGWGYTVFGKVTQGMDVVNKIRDVRTGAKSPFSKDVPLKTVTINKVLVIN